MEAGRNPEADIFVDEPTVSRRHLSIRMEGQAVIVTDLGSANGIRIGDSQIRSGDSMAVIPGTVIAIGATMVVVQRGVAGPPRRVWPHGYFEGRIADACARAERLGRTFAIFRLRTSPEREAELVDEIASVAPSDAIVASYAPGEVHVALFDLSPEAADEAAAKLRASLATAKIAAGVGLARYPIDGTSTEQLVEVAGNRAAPPRQSESPQRIGRYLASVEAKLAPIARGDISVLVIGETGTGKELVAEMVHRGSKRHAQPFLRLNCAAFTEQLLASELFGHERGAFTGADRTKPGLLESAEGGTVFLDEIGELPPALQPKLLRVLEEGQVMRVGGLRPRPLDVRFVSATHRDLENPAFGFRPDLYYRLAGHVVGLLPLRERLEEVPALAAGFLAQAAASSDISKVPTFSEGAIQALTRYTWPGNVRELRNVVLRAFLLADGAPEILADHLPVEKMGHRSVPPGPVTLEESVQDLERQRIVEALTACGGNQTRAAKALGIARSTLVLRMDVFGLSRPRKR